jgi:folate-binding protein YgfZ
VREEPTAESREPRAESRTLREASVIPSAFAREEREAGAVFAERAGVEMPTHFGDPLGEYRAVRSGAGLVDFSFRGLLQLTGGERLRWLNGQISNEVKALPGGAGCLAAALTVKGRLLAELAVYGLTDAVWIDLHRDRLEAVQNAFDRHIIADDVQVADLSARVTHLMVAGPAATHALTAALGQEIADLAPWHHCEIRLGEVPVRVSASRWLRLPGFDVLIPAYAAGAAWGQILRDGSAAGIRPVGTAALEWLRVEAAWPWFGVDYDDNSLLMESLTADHVSFTKGCYVGQEVVIRAEHQGHLNKRLCGLLVTGETVPAPGTPVVLGDRTVGRVTSAVRSPVMGRVIALAHLRRECWEPGTPLCIGAGPGALSGETAALPFLAG